MEAEWNCVARSNTHWKLEEAKEGSSLRALEGS